MNTSNYEIVEKIYESERTVIYRCIRTIDSRCVVLKMLREKFPLVELARIKHEAELLKSFNSNYIVKTFGLDVVDDRHCLVMEDCGGLSIKDYMKENVLCLEDFLYIGVCLAEALEEVHRHNIIHNDINPDNIIFNPDTLQVKLIDFGIAVQMGTDVAYTPHNLIGSLPYIAPEQTGRIRSEVDYRSDYYALGVTFYQILSGWLPFQAEDVMELVHAHIAKKPVPLSELRYYIPNTVSDIVMKLMSKIPEDRYQSTFSMKEDLKRCMNELKWHKQISNFPVGQNDMGIRLKLPEKLYGREYEINQLLSSFSHACEGAFELVLISGYSGVGKTSLVAEAHKKVVERKGYFAYGKYEQYKRNIPYSGLVHAFRGLVQQLLGESPKRIAVWRDKLRHVLGSSGQIIIDVIPEVELVIGKQEPVPELGPMESMNRFHYVFQNFIHIFGNREEPLVVFLDDLQWADAASLKLLEKLIGEQNTGFILFICAYRDNEVDAYHPLQLTLDKLHHSGIKAICFELHPLKKEHITQLLAEALQMDEEKVAVFSEICREKTHGNPFFLKQFLQMLFEGNILSYNTTCCEWSWELTAIRGMAVTENVVEFITSRIFELPRATQKILKLAACIGNRFDLITLSRVRQQLPELTANDLNPALQNGLLLPLEDMFLSAEQDAGTAVYCFLHDRVHQAVYSMIPTEELGLLHRNIGRVLMKTLPQDRMGEFLLEIVNHLNHGQNHIIERLEREELAVLNLQAGRQAKASIAYDASRTYFDSAIQLLGEGGWKEQPLLALTIQEEAAEATFLYGDFIGAEEHIQKVIENTGNVLDRVTVYRLKILLYSAKGQFNEAVELGLDILRQLGIEFPEKPAKEEVIKSYGKVMKVLEGKKVMDFLEHIPMTDPFALAALDIFFALCPVVYMTAPDLTPVFGLEFAYLSLKHGNAPKSAYGYAAFSGLLASAFQDYDTAYEYGQLAILLAKRPEAKRVKAGVIHVTTNFTMHWKEHLRNVMELLMDNFTDMESGDLLHRTYSLATYLNYAFLAGDNLTLLQTKGMKCITASHKLNQQGCTMLMEMNTQAFYNLCEDVLEPWVLCGSFFDEGKDLPILDKNKDNSGKRTLFVLKAGIAIIFHEFRKALDYLQEFEKTTDFTAGPLTAQFFFYEALAMLVCFKEFSDEEKSSIITKVQEYIKKLETWANYAPMNYSHKVCLIKAEWYRVINHTDDAIDMYDEAIRLAKEYEYVHEEALANELAADFWLSKNKNEFAKLYLYKAYYCYEQWGAKGKLREMKENYSKLFEDWERLPGDLEKYSTLKSQELTAETLDLISITKAARTISGEIEVDALLNSMMHIMLENAGAHRGFYIADRNGQLVTEVEMELLDENQETLISGKVSDSCFSTAIVQYVFRTGKAYVLNDPSDLKQFINDPYIIEKELRSVLCIPVMQQGKVLGTLYLENNLLYNAFSEKHIYTLEILAAQVAVSLENAYLYSESKKMVEKLTRVDRLKDEFLANTSHELKTPINAIVNIADGLSRGTEGPVNEKQTANLSLISASGRRLSNLINDILDFSKLKNYDLKMNFQSVDLKRIIETVANVLLKINPNRDIKILIETEDKLPRVKGDENRLIQVFYNLIGNALKFTERGYIRISAKVLGTEVSIFVEDSGIGIPENELDNIFTPFFQLEDSLVRKHDGSGLGLSISRYIIEALGGQLRVESTAGKGSKFLFSLPLYNGADSTGTTYTAPEDTVYEEPLPFQFPYSCEGKGPHIIILDDNIGNLAALVGILRMNDYSVTAVTTAKAFFDGFMEHNDYALVILDVMLPEISGYDICREIRNRYSLSELPILMLTARMSTDDIVIGLESGANDYIVKPFETEELLARIKTLINLKETADMATKAEIAFLQSQIKPHFLYNALNTFVSISLYDIESARNLIMEFGNYLRRTFDFKSLSEFVTLRNELELVKAYVEIEKVRFEDQIQVEFNVQDNVNNEVKIPMLMLQPIVENAIIHGILPKPDCGRVEIFIRSENEYLSIVIKDDGIGMDEERSKEILSEACETGIGLFNIERRLRKLYGCGLKIKSSPHNGTEVSIRIPTHKERD